MIDKGICDKGFIWNPSSCQCECDKSCGIGEYLDYKDCVCRNTFVCRNTKCVSCTPYIVLFAVFFVTSVIIGGVKSKKKELKKGNDQLSSKKDNARIKLIQLLK